MAREFAVGLAGLSLLVSWSCSSGSGSDVDEAEGALEIPREFDRLRLAYRNGADDPFPEGSTCGDFFQNELEVEPGPLDVGSGLPDPFELDWSLCLSEPAGAPYAPVRARRSLSFLELDDITDTFDGIELSNSSICGADGSVPTLEVHVGLAVHLYVDDFIAGCPSVSRARRFVTGLHELQRVLESLVETAP